MATVLHQSSRSNFPSTQSQNGPLVRTVVENAITLHQYVGPQQKIVEDPTNLYMLKDQAMEIIELRSELGKMESSLQRTRVDHAHTKRLLTVCEDQSKIQLQSLHNRAKVMEGEVNVKTAQIQSLLGEFQDKERRIHDAEQRERQALNEIRQIERDMAELERNFNEEMQRSFEAENNARLFLEKLRDLEHSYRELVIRYEETKGLKVAKQKLVKAVPVTVKSEKQIRKDEKKELRNSTRAAAVAAAVQNDNFQTPIGGGGSTGRELDVSHDKSNGFPVPRQNRYDPYPEESRFNSLPQDHRQAPREYDAPPPSYQDQARSPHDDYDDFPPRNADNKLDFSRGKVTGYEV